MTTSAPEFDNSYLRKTMEKVFRDCQVASTPIITIDHFINHLALEDTPFQELLTEAGVDVEEFQSHLSMYVYTSTDGMTYEGIPIISAELQDFNTSIIAAARAKSKTSLNILDIVEQLITEECYAMTYLNDTHSFAAEAKKLIATKEREEKAKSAKSAPSAGKPKSHPLGGIIGMPGMGGETAAPLADAEEALEYFLQFGSNFSADALAGKIDPVIGREKEIAEVTHAINRRRMRNALLVGPAGVGKTAIAEGLALSIEHKTCDASLNDHVVLSLDIGALLAGTKYRGEFEERVVKVFDALALMPNVILFIDEVHQMAGANGGEGSPMNFAQMLKPHLSRSGVRCIAATTAEEFRKHMKDPAIRRRFTVVKVDEPNFKDTVEILTRAKGSYESYHHVDISDEAIDAAVVLTNRYIKTLSQPDKAISLIDSAATHAKLKGSRVVDKAIVEQILSNQLGIQVSTTTASERSVLANLEATLKTKIFGQDKAVELLCDSVIVARMGLREENLPAGCFMLCGPSGTGKTEISIQLAATLDRPFVRLDMSEYADSHSSSKLWGSPPGFVGYNDGGILVNEIREKPTAVILLDEFEKAHRDIQNAFLQVLSAARMTTPQGEVIDFQNTIIILSSNVGGKASLKTGIGFGASPTAGEDAARAEMEKAWSPEFRNRFDAIVIFNRLNQDAIRAIAKAKMNKVSQLAEQKGIILAYDDTLIDYIAENGVDVDMGARPIGRFITENISKPISKKMVTIETDAMLSLSIVDKKLVIE